MGTSEYRLKNTEKQLNKEANQLLYEANKLIFSQLNLTSSEAAFMGNFIYIPKKQKIDDLSSMEIKSPRKKKIDYIDNIKNKNMQYLLRNYQKKHELGQSALKKLKTEFNKIERGLKEEERSFENITRIFNRTTEKIVNEEQITKYIDRIEKNSKKLIDCLFLDNPEVLDAVSKKEIIDNVNILQSYINDLKNQLSD